MVTRPDAAPRYPALRATGRGPAWYRGDCHLHSVLSQGAELSVPQLTAAARALGLDFVATTEHDTVRGHEQWAPPHSGDDLLVILGQEVTTRTGHWLALGLPPEQHVDSGYGIRDDTVERHLDRVRHTGGLCVLAHPYAPYPSGTSAYPYRWFDAVEVWNGLWASDLPWNADNEAALAEWGRTLAHDVHRGRWRPAVGNSDTHLAGQLGTPHTVVFAEDLSTEAILAGLRRGRSWIAESTAVHLKVEASTADHVAAVGQHLPTGGEQATVRVEVSGVPSGVVTLHTERGIVRRATLSPDGTGTTRWRTTADDAGHVRVEVRHPTRQMAALTNPIILT
ncbi:histidinol phosphatase [Verrucosispora sp. SN26_14.1]|uniref:CehA/McbA family metallohydrolase n=1 Tax=Verrucosispora sp. SN26_14.1 TaxID=2527879 RepID=UPI001034A109|nr:CehA/McbA family metallohydrolase [Verrucosispora sp. SN26_14.1]TBL38762.1 histidinol phosphatase [Verrucosispora sp. SN26_14.1]